MNIVVFNMPADIIIPIYNESEMMAMAKRLGYDTLVMAYAKAPKEIPQSHEGLTLRIASLDKPAPWAAMCIAKAMPDSRGLLEHSPISGVYGLESTSPKDFMHQRASGLNRVLANIAARKKKAIIFDFSSILLGSSDVRSVILGRMSQNIRICRKTKAPMVIASMATTPYMMRPPHDLKALFELIGMHPAEATGEMEYLKNLNQ